MFYEKMTTLSALNQIPATISGYLNNTSSVFTYCCPLDNSMTGRYNYYLRGPKHTEQVAYEPRVVTATKANGSNTGEYHITCNYLSGDFFYYNTEVTGKIYFQVSNMAGTAKKGRNIILQVNLGNATSAYFADYASPIMTINTGTDYASGTYYFVFANVQGSSIELVNFFKGYPSIKDSSGLKDGAQ